MKTIYSFLLLILMALPNFLLAQIDLSPVGTIGPCHIIDLYADSTDGMLYATGGIGTINNNDSVDCVIKWDGTTWQEEIIHPNITHSWSTPKCFARFQNSLYLAGDIVKDYTQTVWNSTPILKRENGQWNSVIDSVFHGVIRNILATDTMLYACGQFDSIGGYHSFSIIGYDGNNVHTFPDIPNISSSTKFNCMEMYKGELYVGGNILCNCANWDKNDIVRWDGIQWKSVGGGTPSTNGTVLGMTQYQGKLIVAGNMQKNGGDPANSCAAWDGNAWTSMDLWQSPNAIGRLNGIHVYNNELYGVGFCDQNGNDTVSLLFKWNGSIWDEIGQFDKDALTMETWNGDLYIGGVFEIANGLPCSGVCKYNDKVGITNVSPQGAIKLYPNPSQDILQVTLSTSLFSEVYDLEIKDIKGQSVYQKSMTHPNTVIDIKNLPQGVYFLVLRNHNKIYSERFIKE